MIWVLMRCGQQKPYNMEETGIGMGKGVGMGGHGYIERKGGGGRREGWGGQRYCSSSGRHDYGQGVMRQ